MTVGQAATPLSRAARSFLAFDFGTARLGVATGNSVTRTAMPLKTLTTRGDDRWREIAGLVREWAPSELVVGVPFHPDGARHANTRRARAFARSLERLFELPVREVDERYTTVEASSRGARDLDSAAAALILEQHLAGLE